MDLDDIFFSKGENIRHDNSYDEESLSELRAAIQAVGGLLQPLGVAPIVPEAETEEKSFGLVWGFRRYMCLRELAKEDPERFGKNIPVVIIDEAETIGATRIVQLMENEQRKALNPIEKANAIKEALDDPGAKLKAQDLAKVFGMSEAAVSQHLKFLELPKAIQEQIAGGEISFSHARLILYKVPKDHWADVAKIAPKMTYGKFEAHINDHYGQAPSDPDAAASGSASVSSGNSDATDGTQKGAQLLRATELNKAYIPFVKKRLEKADATNKVYTEADLEKVRLDTLNTVLRSPDTELAKAIKPFVEEQEAAEKQEKAGKEANEKKEKFYREQVKLVEQLFTAPADPTKPDAPRPTLAQCYAEVAKRVVETTEEKRKELGFELETDKGAATKLLTDTYAEVMEERKKRKAEADKRKADKEAEEAKKKAAEGTPAAETKTE
jgi:ParB/RepB/Spo0J family partition protein